MALSKELEKIGQEPTEKIIQKPTLFTKEFLAEEVWNREGTPQFYVRYFNEDKNELKDRLDLGEKDLFGRPIIYVPVDNTALRKGLVLLPSEPKETTFKEVFEKIDSFAFRCYDALGQEPYVKLLSRVAAASWFLDRFVANPRFDVAGAGKFAPIIPIRGPSESGKNRLAFVFRLLSYRPYFEMSTYRVPSLYRPLDLWGGTLVLDEADFANTNEKSELIHFLNCRATGTPISRQDPKSPRKTDVFANFGITILTQRRAFDDNATESRCLPYYSERTDRKLPTVETDDMLAEGLELQNMLFYLRLKFYRNVAIDKTAWINEIADPRLVSSLLPLLALSKFEPTIKDTIETVVKDIAKLKVEQKSNSVDGTLLNSLWEKGLFAVYSGMPNNEHYYFQRKEFDDDDQSASVIPLTISVLAEEFKSTSRNIRKTLTSLNLCAAGLPKVVKVGNKNYRVIFFDPPKLEKRLREFVIDYEPYELYDKLGLEKPKTATQATHATLPACGAKQLDGFLKNEPCAGSVASVTSVAEKAKQKILWGLDISQVKSLARLTTCFEGTCVVCGFRGRLDWQATEHDGTWALLCGSCGEQLAKKLGDCA